MKKNNSINFMKGCACFGVLYMHTSYDCMISSIIACLMRFGVLIFFMVSGYYSFNTNEEIVNSKMPKKVKHIGKLCMWSTIIYFVWDCFISKMLVGMRVDIISYLVECITFKNLIDFIFFNQLPFGGILWFLFALLYCYLIFWAINKFNWYKVAYILIPILIVLHIVTRGYIQYNGLIEESVNIIYYRNFIFMGFPFFMMGNFIHRYEEKLISIFTNKKLILLIIFGLGLSCVERFVVPLELFWGTVLATFCMFVFAVKNPEKKVIPIITTIGEKYSMHIYIGHIIVNGLLNWIKSLVSLENNIVLNILNPILIFAIIPIIIFIFQNVWRKIISYKEVK